jgi:hypothetical protein
VDLKLEFRKREEANVDIPMTASRADMISRLWNVVAYLEEVRGELPQCRDLRTTRATDPIAILLTECTQRLVVAVGLLHPNVPKAVPAAALLQERRRIEGQA